MQPTPVPAGGGKAVPSAVPSQGPRDLSAAVARHRAREAGPTEPPGVPAGGWPATVGTDPDAPPGITPSDKWTGDPLTSATPDSFQQGAAWTTGSGGNY